MLLFLLFPYHVYQLFRGRNIAYSLWRSNLTTLHQLYFLFLLSCLTHRRLFFAFWFFFSFYFFFGFWFFFTFFLFSFAFFRFCQFLARFTFFLIRSIRKFIFWLTTKPVFRFISKFILRSITKSILRRFSIVFMITFASLFFLHFLTFLLLQFSFSFFKSFISTFQRILRSIGLWRNYWNWRSLLMLSHGFKICFIDILIVSFVWSLMRSW